MARHQVLKQDAVVAVFLVDASMADGGLRHSEDAPGATFARDPDADHLQLVCCHSNVVNAHTLLLCMCLSTTGGGCGVHDGRWGVLRWCATRVLVGIS